MKRKVPFFSVLGDSRTYLGIVYILIAFPLSVVYFSIIVTGVSLSAGLLVLVIGFFIFMAILMLLGAFRWLDTVIWSVAVSFIAITFDLLVIAPLLSDYWWYNDEFTRWLIDFFGDVYVLPFLGMIWGMISLHVIRGLAWVSREVNVAFLQD